MAGRLVSLVLVGLGCGDRTVAWVGEAAKAGCLVSLVLVSQVSVDLAYIAQTEASVVVGPVLVYLAYIDRIEASVVVGLVLVVLSWIGQKGASVVVLERVVVRIASEYLVLQGGLAH